MRFLLVESDGRVVEGFNETLNIESLALTTVEGLLDPVDGHPEQTWPLSSTGANTVNASTMRENNSIAALPQDRI